MYEAVSDRLGGGRWPELLAGLKALLETGRTIAEPEAGDCA